MNALRAFIELLKMLYNLLWYSASLVTFLFNLFWLICTLASAGIPWFTLILVTVCIASKFIKLKSPNEKMLISLLGGDSVDDLSYWPIANRGGAYDAPENSMAALKKCSTNGFRNVLLDAGLTSCGEIVLLHKTTLEKAGLSGSVHKHTLDALQEINFSELHPLGPQFEPETAVTLTSLMEMLDKSNLTIFLFISDTSAKMIDKLSNVIKSNEQFTRRTIIISRSPISIYQLRKLHPELICGLWTEKTLSLAVLKASTLITSIYGAVFRNIIAPVIGISLVFISKDEFNLHIAELWRNVGVRPIVYNVNSPNEKRYFQKTMKTQYLTDSLRSEPHLIMRT